MSEAVEDPTKRVGRSSPLPFAAPLLGEEDIEEVLDTLRSGWLTTGPKTAAFAAAFADRVGAPAALAVNSCTAALHVALAAAGIGPGDLVFTSTMTFCSTVHVIEHLGARAVLVDVEPDTLNLDPAALAAAIDREVQAGGRPAAIIPVHFAGHPCDMSAILDVARRHQLFVLEDAAHALPARHRGNVVGSCGNESGGSAVAFSFYATKNLTTGEGGMLTGSVDLVEEARIWSLHGMTRDAWKRYEVDAHWFYEVVRPGFKYNMSDIAAAIGLQQLKRLDHIHDRRREIFARYSAELAGYDALELPTTAPTVQHAYHLYTLRVRPDILGFGRQRCIDELARRGISTSVHFIPVHLHPYYRDKYGYAPEDFPVAYSSYERMLSLPVHLRMSDEDVDDVVRAVGQVVGRGRS